MLRCAQRTLAGSMSTADSSVGPTSAASAAPTAPEPQQTSTTVASRAVTPAAHRTNSSVRRRGTNTPSSTAIRSPQNSAQPTTCSSGTPEQRRATMPCSAVDVVPASTSSRASSSANTQPAALSRRATVAANADTASPGRSVFRWGTALAHQSADDVVVEVDAQPEVVDMDPLVLPVVAGVGDVGRRRSQGREAISDGAERLAQVDRVG